MLYTSTDDFYKQISNLKQKSRESGSFLFKVNIIPTNSLSDLYLLYSSVLSVRETSHQ